MFHRLVDCFGSLELVGTRQQIYGHRASRLSVKPPERVVILRPKFYVADIFNPNHCAGGGLTNDYVFELFRRNQASGSAQSLSHFLVFWSGSAADFAGRCLNVLLLDRRYDVGWYQTEFAHHVGLDPDAHSIVGAAEQINLGDAGNTQKLVTQVDTAIVDQEVCVISVFG